MTRQLKEWSGRFGDEYTDRNIVDWRRRQPLFEEMLKGLRIRTVLEVGCNRGHNLVALSHMLGGPDSITGVEPNPHARALARTADPRLTIVAGNASALPFLDSTFDLTMTWGVLIHVPLEELPRALGEIVRVSKRYILAIEYFAEEETTIPYRGHNDLLWKRNFLSHYQKLFPKLQLVRDGFWGKEQGADRVTWWLLEKPEGG